MRTRWNSFLTVAALLITLAASALTTLPAMAANLYVNVNHPLTLWKGMPATDEMVLKVVYQRSVHGAGQNLIGLNIKVNGVDYGFVTPDEDNVNSYTTRNGVKLAYDNAGTFTVTDLGGWTSERLGPVNTDPPRIPVQTAR